MSEVFKEIPGHPDYRVSGSGAVESRRANGSRWKRLYRDYGTFEDYLRERWNLARNRGYQLMDAAITIRNVQNFGQGVVDTPVRESQAHALEDLEPEEQAEAWEEACETAPNGKPTAKHIKEVVDRFKGRPEQPRPERRLEPESVPDDFGRDWIKWWEEQNLFLVSLPRRGPCTS